MSSSLRNKCKASVERALKIVPTVILLGFISCSWLVIAASKSPGPQSPSDRYVSPAGNDSNDGSERHPWATLTGAAARATGGTTIHVMPGSYGAVVTSVSGTPAARVRFLSDKKWEARILSTGAYSAWTNNGNYVDIIGFDISGTGNLGIANWGSGVRIVANHVHDIAAPGCPSNGGAGIVNANYSGMDNEIIGNVVHDVGDLSKLCPRVHGIYHSNAHGRVVNNIAYRNEGFGIHLWHAASDVTVANNLVFNNYYGGILIGAGDAPFNADPRHPADDILVVNNIVVFNLHRNGIEEMGTTGWHIQYLNNLVYKNQGKDWKLKTGRQFATITADPQFVYYMPDGTGDYHLLPGSPAVSAGTPTGAPGTDIEGRPRPRGKYWDLGPYQFGPPTIPVWPQNW